MEVLLDELADESRVLKQFDGFPIDRLDSMRHAVALHRRLRRFTSTMESWEVDPNKQLRDELVRAKGYFEMIRPELDSIERNQEANKKRFLNHKINFDFKRLRQAREAALHISVKCAQAACAESQRTGRPLLAQISDAEASCNQGEKGTSSLKQRRSSARRTAMLLWSTFQFTYKLYQFVGGTTGHYAAHMMRDACVNPWTLMQILTARCVALVCVSSSSQ